MTIELSQVLDGYEDIDCKDAKLSILL